MSEKPVCAHCGAVVVEYSHNLNVGLIEITPRFVGPFGTIQRTESAWMDEQGDKALIKETPSCFNTRKQRE